MTSNPLPRFLYHLNQNRSRFLWVSHFPGERDPDGMHTVFRFQPQVKAQAIDRYHRCFLRFYPGKAPCQNNQGIGVVSVHVLDDFRGGVGQRISFPSGVFIGGHPTHHAKTSHVVDIDHLHSVEGEVLEVHPIPGVFVPRQIESRTCFSSSSGTVAVFPISVTRAAPSGSPLASGWVTSRLARESPRIFWVCMAMVLMRKEGRPG